ncbi:MAG: hypothetical protein LQ342_003458 [Letrouitia transgressa]|nr:MAG: hypothetical protein LQ342_003458 [Letrouitia transgressa]
MTTIQNWFKGLCNQGNGAPPPQQNGNGQSTPSTTSRTTSPTSIAPAATNSGVRLTQANEPNEAQKGWMSTHWRWVLMLIILALGLSGLAYGGWWYRRRYHRKKAEEEAGPRPDFSVWGPGNSVHDVQDFGSGGQGAASAQRDKGKSREMAEVQAAPESSGRRLKSLRRN